MTFRQLVKKVDKSNSYKDDILVNKIKAQYNPERFHLWEALHKGPKGEELNMLYSPHLRFLKDRNNTAYYRLQRLYGRNNKWIELKKRKFLDVLHSMKNEGITQRIEIVEKPLIKNKYNKGFEIFEGHHRIACALYLGIKEVPCRIIRRK